MYKETPDGQNSSDIQDNSSLVDVTQPLLHHLLDCFSLPRVNIFFPQRSSHRSTLCRSAPRLEGPSALLNMPSSLPDPSWRPPLLPQSSQSQHGSGAQRISSVQIAAALQSQVSSSCRQQACYWQFITCHVDMSRWIVKSQSDCAAGYSADLLHMKPTEGSIMSSRAEEHVAVGSPEATQKLLIILPPCHTFNRDGLAAGQPDGRNARVPAR